MENPQPESGWSYTPETDEAASEDVAPLQQIEPVTWTGSEFIAIAKTPQWYLGFTGFIALSCAVLFLISGRDLIPVISVAIMGVLFVVIAGKQPRQLQYSVSERGVSVGQRQYSFSEFKSFSLQHDGAIGYLSFLPLHRFKPELCIYFAPEHEQKIFDTVAVFLPNEQRVETAIDKLVKRMHF